MWIINQYNLNLFYFIFIILFEIMSLFSFIFAYYLFTFEQYLIHNIQHTTYIWIFYYTFEETSPYLFKNGHYKYYNNKFSVWKYRFIFVFIVHYFIFTFDILLFQAVIAWVSYYFHDEYHTPNTIWKNWSFFKYLKKKHKLHHIYPRTNYFLIDPTFDIIFSTYK